MRPNPILSAVLAACLLAAPVHAEETATDPDAPHRPLQTMAPSGSTADHSKFEILQQKFTSGPAVTAACLSCHNEADDQVMHSIHFEWDYTHPETGQQLGKQNVLNAFCGNVAGNEPRCTSCHAGYGWDDMSQPAAAQATPDCLVCHDRSGQYTKTATGAGHPPLSPVPEGMKTITGAAAWPVDLTAAAQSVGKPGRDNCGSCHFYGGGGDNVKHGDLSSALYQPTRDVDVHMAADGANFACTECHVSNQHDWAGSRYSVHASDPEGMGRPGARRDVATCQSCHGNTPHEAVSLKGAKLNDHTDVLACQTCHIPSFARGGVATKTYWDWSAAGRLDADGKPIVEHDFVQSDGQHLHTYLSTKGIFDWGEDVTPLYAWFDGQVEYTTGEQTIDPTEVVEVNRIHGAREDGVSRIWPFKRMEGRQAYDSVNNTLVYTHVWGPKTDTAFWTNFDWAKAIEAGMTAANRPYSGAFDFVDTYMYWPTTHMVAPAEQALECQSCHAEDGRMADMAGVFMPGTDPGSMTGRLGQLIVVLAALGVAGHFVLRMVSGRKSGGNA